MRRPFILIAALFMLVFLNEPGAAEERMTSWGLAIHGGAGVIRRDSMTSEQEAAYHAALGAALAAGQRILEAGGTGVDAVVAAVRTMENSPLFNAGKGSVFNAEGGIEMDAAIMDGATLKAGAVGGVTRARNPIVLARAVMDHSPHVMLIGAGAETFAEAQDIELVDPAYFRTERRLKDLERARREDAIRLDHFGTVGAVALDSHGNLAAATSTGGLTNKRWGRIGDSPIIGAGTYASNASAAVSGTGQGEYFIRLTLARDIAALMEYGGRDLATAARTMIHGKLAELGGTGGVIAIDRKGDIVMTFNTPGMYRASVRAGEEPVVEIYGE